MNDQQKDLLIAIGNNLCDWDDTPGASVSEVAGCIGLSQERVLDIAYGMEESLFRGGLPGEDDYFQLSPYGWDQYCSLSGRYEDE